MKKLLVLLMTTFLLLGCTGAFDDDLMRQAVIDHPMEFDIIYDWNSQGAVSIALKGDKWYYVKNMSNFSTKVTSIEPLFVVYERGEK